MRRIVLAFACAVALTVVAVALAADRSTSLSAATPSAEWDGAAAFGFALAYDSSTGGPCNASSPVDHCDQTLLHVDLPDQQTATLTVGIGATTSDDFDLYVYRSDENGTIGALAGKSEQAAPAAEQVTVTGASGYYLVNILSAGTSGADKPHGTAALSDLPQPAVTPTPTASAEPSPTPTATQPPAATPVATASPTPTATPRPAQPFQVHFAIIPRSTQRVVKRGLAGILGCAAPCRAAVVARWKKRVIARGTYTLASPGRRGVHIRFSKATKRRLLRSRRAPLLVRAQVTGADAPARTYTQRPIIFPATP